MGDDSSGRLDEDSPNPLCAHLGGWGGAGAVRNHTFVNCSRPMRGKYLDLKTGRPPAAAAGSGLDARQPFFLTLTAVVPFAFKGEFWWQKRT